MMYSINPMKIVSVLIFVSGLLFFSCSGGQTGSKAQRPAPLPVPANPALEVYATLNDQIESGGDQIDYDTLRHVYQTMIETPHEIAHMDRLLTSLINKRNSNPRVDQMILIFSAKVLGQSKYPITDIDTIFESILSKDDRLSQWVLAFVSEAIADYGQVIPEGDKLVDLAEKKANMLTSESGPRKENFGSHFLPPPKGDYIRSYIDGIQSRTLRETERNHYYLLISAGYTESDIEAALKRLRGSGTASEGQAAETFIKFLSRNRGRIHSDGN
ncbi:MAG: hypothetical protein PVG41_07105 [Desulfobacteraceae bacterium]|jgi:hypothetical protein